MKIPTIELYQYIGLMVRIKRKGAGLSQDQLAKAMGVTRTSVVNLEQGRQKIPLEKLYAVAMALNCNIRKIIP